MPIAIVGGALANKPGRGGAAWVRLSYALGLQRLGWTVFFIEEIASTTLVDDQGRPSGLADSINLAYVRRVLDAFGLGKRAALIVDGGRTTWGLTVAECEEAAASADVLVNVGGNLRIERVKARPRRRIFVDLDPGYTQAWLVAGVGDLGVASHDAYFTVGGNIGGAGCRIPTAGITWRPTVPPVVLEQWPVTPVASRSAARFTTVAAWRGPYGPVSIGSRTLGPKAHEFRRFAGVPAQSPGQFEVALDIDDADASDRAMLQRNGWSVVDPGTVACDPESFREYVSGSGAEFSPAQSVFVQTRSGWLSDRTTRYLAAGRPALVQDTGLAGRLPVGEGLLVFRTPAQAVEGARRIAEDHEHHARAARALAEELFDSDRVLSAMLEEAEVAAA